MNASDFPNVETRRYVSVSPFSFLMFRLMVIGLAMFWSVLQKRFWSGPAPAGSRRAEAGGRAKSRNSRKQRTEFIHSEQERAIGLADGSHQGSGEGDGGSSGLAEGSRSAPRELRW